MLKRKRHDILDPFDRNGQRISREPFANDDLDPAYFIRRAPVALSKHFAAEWGEPKGFEVTILGEICFPLASKDLSSHRARLTEAMVD